MANKKVKAVPEVAPVTLPPVVHPIPKPDPFPPIHQDKFLFQVVVTSDIVVTGDKEVFNTTREVTWEVKAPNAGEAAYEYWKGVVTGWKKIS